MAQMDTPVKKAGKTILSITAPKADQTGSPSAPKLSMPDARDYNELMDVYSLHQLIIRKGKILDQTPEFISFKRTYISKWGQISYILMLLEKMLSKAAVEMAYVEGRKVAALCFGDIDLSRKPTDEELFNCISNKDEVSASIQIPSLMFKGH